MESYEITMTHEHVKVAVNDFNVGELLSDVMQYTLKILVLETLLISKSMPKEKQIGHIENLIDKTCAIWKEVLPDMIDEVQEEINENKRIGGTEQWQKRKNNNLS